MKKFLVLFIALYFTVAVVYAENVVYNPNSKIYHKLNCYSAQICKNCIKIDKQEAIRRGGRSCKKCGG